MFIDRICEMNKRTLILYYSNSNKHLIYFHFYTFCFQLLDSIFVLSEISNITVSSVSEVQPQHSASLDNQHSP